MAEKIKALVLDTGPLLLGSTLREKAESYHTIPAVLAEIRDKKSRDYFDRLGIDLQLREPAPESVKAVVDFAKLTGDYATLSTVDLQVLALAHTLEVEHNGTWRIRTRPGKRIVPPKKEEDPAAEQESTKKGGEEVKSRLPEQAKTPEEAKTDAAASESRSVAVQESQEEASKFVDEASSAESGDASDSSDGEWITPENVGKHRARDLGLDSADTATGVTPPTMKVALMTTDYAMQNVLIQMGLNLVTTDGLRIKQLRTYVLRCHACFKITRDMDKKFCPSCGNATLLRASTTTHPDGTVQIHLKKNFQHRLRGTKYSIPETKGGRLSNGPNAGNNLILREDQKEFQRSIKYEQHRKDKLEKAKSGFISGGASSIGGVFDDDWIPGMLMGEGGRHKSNEKQGIKVVGHGRKNPNERRRKK